MIPRAKHLLRPPKSRCHAGAAARACARASLLEDTRCTHLGRNLRHPTASAMFLPGAQSIAEAYSPASFGRHCVGRAGILVFLLVDATQYAFGGAIGGGHSLATARASERRRGDRAATLTPRRLRSIAISFASALMAVLCRPFFGTRFFIDAGRLEYGHSRRSDELLR